MKIFAVLGVWFLVQGCAFTDATLEMDVMSVEANMTGPISTVEPLSFKIEPLEDGRVNKHRIGWKQNTYGANTADILSSRPVTELGADGLSRALSENGHGIAGSGDVTITGTVKNFWFEVDTNFWTVEFIGDIVCDLVFLDARGEQFYQSTYTGSYSEKKGGGLEKTWTEVMNKALVALAEDLAYDEDLVEALEGIGSQ